MLARDGALCALTGVIPGADVSSGGVAACCDFLSILVVAGTSSFPARVKMPCEDMANRKVRTEDGSVDSGRGRRYDIYVYTFCRQ